MWRFFLDELSMHVVSLIRLVFWVERIEICELLIDRVCIKLSLVVFNVEEKNVTEEMARVLSAVSLDKRV